jgi:hypothetical protein
MNDENIVLLNLLFFQRRKYGKYFCWDRQIKLERKNLDEIFVVKGRNGTYITFVIVKSWDIKFFLQALSSSLKQTAITFFRVLWFSRLFQRYRSVFFNLFWFTAPCNTEKKFGCTLTLAKMTIWDTLSSKKTKKVLNSIFDGTPDTSSLV